MSESLKDLLISKLGLRLPTAELSPENERLYQELRKRELARPPQGMLENIYDTGKNLLSGLMYDPTQRGTRDAITALLVEDNITSIDMRPR